MAQIYVLPDDVLLDIFDFYVALHSPGLGKLEVEAVEAWQSLVHVCRRWRNVVFRSPRRLNLRLRFTPKTPARDTLDIWPAFPLVICGYMNPSETENVIAALEQSNRVCQVDLTLLNLAGWQMEKFLAPMQVPFPGLTDLRLFSFDKRTPVIPDSFLGGSAPRLQFLQLRGIPFPGLPKLRSSATHLVNLHLENIPISGYISPEAIVALISVLFSLNELTLEFQSPQSRPDRETRLPPPSNRSVIPALHDFRFKGAIEYLEDLVTCVDAPQLKGMYIKFFNQIDFDTPRLAHFINRTPTLRKSDAHVRFYDYFAHVELHAAPKLVALEIAISCGEPDWQLSSIEQVCNSFWLPLSTVEHLYIERHYLELFWRDDAIENTLWLQLLLPFTAVKNLYLHEDFAPGIAAALQELDGGRITEVLPSLQSIFVQWLKPSGPFQENIGQFVAARRLFDHPITIFAWDESSNFSRKYSHYSSHAR